MNQISLPTTKDRILDSLLTYSVMDIGLRVDADMRFEIRMGGETFISIWSESSKEKLGEKMLFKLEELSKRFSIADRLNFFVNIGNMKWSVKPSACIYCNGRKGCDFHGTCGKTNIPAYAVFVGYIDKAIACSSFPWNHNPILKTRPKSERNFYSTLYVGVSPYWSKGLKIWDRGRWVSSSTYVVHPILPFAYYGLALYTVNRRVGDVLSQVIFSPPLGRTLSHRESMILLTLVRRIISVTSLRVHEFFRLELPTIAIPLSLPCLLDIPAIYMLYEVMPSMLLVNYDMGRGCPKNPRGYEEFSLSETLEFYKRLGVHFWSFKSMINDLVSIARKERYKSQVFNILIGLALGVKNREPSYLNDALIKIQSLKKEVKLNVLGGSGVLAAHKALSSY